MRILTLIIGAVIIVYSYHVSGDELYVASGGDDGGEGTLERPLASLERARDIVRARIARGLSKPQTIYLRGGVYRLQNTVTFGPQDSGTDRYPVTYTSFPGEVAVISGGVEVSRWKKDKDGKWLAELPGKGAPSWRPRQLFIGGERRIRARNPNVGFYAGMGSLEGRILYLPRGQLKHLKRPKEVEMVSLLEWTSTRMPLGKYDELNSQVSLPRSILWFVTHNHINKNLPHYPYYFENAAEFVDAPGEWHLDAGTGQLAYLPMAGENSGTTVAVVPRLEVLVDVSGTPGQPVRNVHFKNLVFEHTDWPLSANGFVPAQACFEVNAQPPHPWGPVRETGQSPAVRFQYAQGCVVSSCQFRNLGGAGLGFERGCRDNRINGNRLSRVGGNGIQVGEPVYDEAKPGDMVQGNTISGNDVSWCGLDYPGAVGIVVCLARDTLVSSNRVSWLPYSGISMGWNWSHQKTVCESNRIEGNIIHHVMGLLTDGGGIYVLGNQPGGLLRGNLVHDVPHFSGVADTKAFFLDNGSEGWHLTDNVSYYIEGADLKCNPSDTSPSYQTWGYNWLGVSPHEADFDRDRKGMTLLARRFDTMRAEQDLYWRLKASPLSEVSPAAGQDGNRYGLTFELENGGLHQVAGSVEMILAPPEAGRIESPAVIACRIDPGKTVRVPLEVTLKPGVREAIIGTRMAGSKGPWWWTRLIKKQISPWLIAPCQSSRPEGIPDSLSTRPPQLIKFGPFTVAEMRLGVSGWDLAVHVKVRDKNITRAKNFWEGSTLEIYASPDAGTTIGQICFLPGTKTESPRVLRYLNGGAIENVASIRWHCKNDDDGYQVAAWIPLSHFGVSAHSSRFKVECAMTGSPAHDVPPTRMTLFGSRNPHVDNADYGHVYVKGEN